MNDLDEYRICNTADLRTLVKTATRFKFNRVPALPGDLDEKGIHLLARELYGHNIDQAGVLHHRCRLLMKREDSMTPDESFIDVLEEHWNALPVPEPVDD